ncbi:MAG: GNAT family N-acetyltransferase [Dehalococcoidia bacterium]|nr:GNAT family N-acetyltransferase [Dehalococcoidia bacterium]
MAETIIIRRMEPSDEKYVLAIDQKIVGEARAASWQQRVFRYLERYYPPVSHIAKANGVVVGFIIGDIRGWEYGMASGAWIDIMGVDTEYQGQGVGRRLVEAFVAQCRHQGIKGIQSFMRDDDTRIQRFLESVGFSRGTLVEYSLEV